jgi:ABC-2 type transport system permease protein
VRSWLALAGVFVRRDLSIARTYPLPFVLQLVASAGILLVLNRIGSLVDPDRSTDPAMQAGFFSYVLIGMVVLQFVTATVVSFSAQLREEQTTGTFEALLSTPAAPAALGLCLATYQVLRGVLASLILVVAGAVAGAHFDITPQSGLAAAAAVVGLICVSAAAGVVVAAFIVIFKRGGGLSGWLITVVAFFSGVYFPVSQLPTVAQWLADALPFTWGITAVRSAVLLGDVDVPRSVGSLVAGLVLLAAALWVFARAVDHARRRGTLGLY